MPVKRTLFKLQRVIGRYRFLYYPLYFLLGKKRELAVHSGTEIVIEGFPRSANSFSVVAFEQAQQRSVEIAHHLHIPAQIIQGVRQGIPVMVLVRHPVSAVSSLVVREPYLDLKTALNDYINFHKSILPYRKSYLVARFEDVTSNYSKVMDDLNRHFGTDFRLFEHSQINVKHVFSELESLEHRSGGRLVDENRVARPSSQRKDRSDKLVKRLQSPEYEKSLDHAVDLYNRVLGR